MSAEILRRAAALMRERAEAANPDAPWLRLGQLTGEFNVPTSEHIASWHPAVALAVADLLDAQANEWEQFGAQADPNVLAVARAYLNESA